MSNLLFGILVVSFSAIGYFFSWKYRTKDNYKIAILLLIVCGLALRVFTSADFFLNAWDERYHALVAKNLILHPFVPTLYENPLLPYDYKSWVANHIWVHKQPLPLWGMALSMWMFGVNEIALRLPSILLSTAGIYLTFVIGNYFFNKKTGYLAAFFFSINGLIIELTAGRVATDHIDIYFLFFVELAIVFSIYFAKKGKMIFNILAGISIGAAILSKWLPALIVLPIWLLIVIDTGKFKPKDIITQFVILIVTSVIISLPWQIYIYHAFPLEARWEASFNFKHITEALEGRTGPFYYFVNQVRINYGELIYLPLLWFFWKTFKNTGNKKLLAISIWFLIPFAFFSYANTKMQAYILFTSPALFIMTAEFWFMLASYRENHKYKWFFNLILLLLIALPIRYSIERIKPFKQADRNPKWTNELKKLNERNISKGVLFNYDNPIEAMFYTDLTVYQHIPEPGIINNLQQKGYTILINDKGNIPENIKTMRNINTVYLQSPNP
jgi:4-amino-4-deoxy-L-arabinose transferase-like glycosyltransferase